MEQVMVTAGVILVPSLLVVLGLRLTGRRVNWSPLLWAGLASTVYFLLLRSGSLLPQSALMAGLTLTWFGKTLSLIGTLLLLFLLPGVRFKEAGFTWKQDPGSLRPVLIAGAMTLLSSLGSAIAFAPSPNASFAANPHGALR
jgi:hypothetical protein